ncbi:MAG: hypothetical protein LC775_17020 [Acidobacteria bacterium]|nr:hypothetical protein [Acidobacteriota bacterium]
MSHLWLGEEKRGNSERVAQMGWEQRGNNRYYYRKEGEGPRVKSVYVGRGEIAQIVAQIQSSSAVLEKLFPLTRASRKDGMEKADAALKQASDLIDLITRSALIAAGFHTHKRQWRKKRDGGRKAVGKACG